MMKMKVAIKVKVKVKLKRVRTRFRFRGFRIRLGAPCKQTSSRCGDCECSLLLHDRRI